MELKTYGVMDFFNEYGWFGAFALVGMIAFQVCIGKQGPPDDTDKVADKGRD